MEKTAEDMVKSLLNNTLAKAVPNRERIKIYPNEVNIVVLVEKVRREEEVSNKISAGRAIAMKFDKAIAIGVTPSNLYFIVFTLIP